MQTPQKTIILFDIDHTLFDAALYREKIFDILVEKLSYTNKKELHEVMEEIYLNLRKEMNFEPTVFINRVLERFHLQDNQQELEKLLLEEHALSSYLFDETEEVISELSKIKQVTLGIFSGGRKDLQLGKLKKILHFFDKNHVHIIRNRKNDKLPNILKKYTKNEVFIIDDVLEMLQYAKHLDPHVQTVWSKRGRFAKYQKPIKGFQADYEITDLRELVPIITMSFRND